MMLTQDALGAWLDARGRLDVTGRRCHFIGIGGCGMSGLARMLAMRGARISGSDASESPVTEALHEEHPDWSITFDQAQPVPGDTELVIASAAIKPEHVELMSAVEGGLPVLTYAEALGLAMRGTTGLAIAGTHGKSTTSAMLGHVLRECGLDPTVIVGATCAQLDPGAAHPTGFRMGAHKIPTGALAGKPGILVAEACEYNRSFLNFAPTIGVITSVEADHLDIYGSLDAVVDAFAQFAHRVAPAAAGGKLLIAHDGAHRREISAGLECEVRTIGFNPAADYYVTYHRQERRVTVSNGTLLGAWAMQLPGEHMAMNAATAFVLALWLGAEPDAAAKALGDFQGLDRRLQFVGELATGGGVARVFDDYGHHPTEVETTLRALREAEVQDGGRLICVFQPHQHSRTRHLLEEFAQSFAHADVVIVPHIYFVRDSENERTKVSAADLVDRLRQRRVKAMHVYPFDAIVEQLVDICRAKDVVVVMGAGPVWKVAHGLVKSGSPVGTQHAVAV
ncbi:MAG: UDP-N-acetylmuramate--L-alanine ligase [Phycisphaerales bacterium]|nr:UDP-N-acetylmuramate--L-alanine ligase [Phycisphaerales bacterium]